MSDSNQVALAFAPESVFNQNPGASGNWTALRILSESLKQDIAAQQSNEIRGYRDIPALNRTDRNAGGAINQSLYYDDNATSELMRHGMGSGAWSSEATVIAAANCSTVQSTRTISLATGSWANTPAVGSWIYISGSGAAATNGYHKVASATASALTVEAALGADEATISLTIGELAQITNGNSLTTMAIQRDYTDLSSIGAYYLGMAVAGFSLDSSGQDTVKFATDWVGAQEVSDLASESIDNAASLTPEMTSIDGVQWCREGSGSGNVVDLDILSFGFQVSANIRKQYKLGVLGPNALKPGDFVVTGTVQAYFETATLFNKFLDFTGTGLSLGVSDEVSARGNGFIFDFPTAKFTDGQRVAGGRNQDIIADLSWQATYDATAAHTMKVARVASA